jgi:hypothetical protein
MSKTTPQNPRLAAIAAEVERLEGERHTISEHIAALKDERAEIMSPFKVGQLISWKVGNSRVPGIVKGIGAGYDYNGGYSIVAARILKNGTEGSKTQLHFYHKVEAR